MSKMRFPCRVENGKLKILSRSEFDSIIADLNGDYYIEIVETGVRSSQQNNYYWKIVDMLADDLGYGDLGIYGGDIPTPNIDRIGEEGIKVFAIFSLFLIGSYIHTLSRL